MHVSTVSRVLNGSPTITVRPETRQRIIDTARRLRYRPNAIARGLKTANAGALGLLVPSLRNPVYSSIIRGAFDRAWAGGMVVLLAEDTGGTSAQQAYESLVAEGRIDGLLIASARPANPILKRFAEELVPCVFVNRRHRGSGCNVSMREEDAGRLAAEHLLELGHRRLGHVSGPAASGHGAAADAGLRRCRDRRRGGCPDRGGGLRRAWRCAGDGHAADRTTTTHRDVRLEHQPGGRGARRGPPARVSAYPADVSMVGYDDDPLTDYLEVPLTAIRMPLWELGATAVDVLIEQLNGGPPRDVELEPPRSWSCVHRRRGPRDPGGG